MLGVQEVISAVKKKWLTEDVWAIMTEPLLITLSNVEQCRATTSGGTRTQTIPSNSRAPFILL